MVDSWNQQSVSYISIQFQVKCPCVDGPQNLARSSMKQVLEDYHEAIYDLVSFVFLKIYLDLYFWFGQELFDINSNNIGRNGKV